MVFECLYNPYITKFYCVLFVFPIITSNSSSANQFLKHFSSHADYLESKYFFSYLLSQYNIILDSHEILMERNLLKHLVQLPAHINYEGKPGLSGLYCENKGWRQHTLLITKQLLSADESFSFHLVWTFSVYAHCLSTHHQHIVMNSLASPSQLHSIIL